MDRSYRVFGLATVVMLSVVIAVMTMLLVFEQSLQHQIQHTRFRAPILVTRSVTLNAGTASAITMPMAWSKDDLHTLLQGLDSLGSATGFSADLGFVERASGRHEQVTLLRAGVDMLGYLSLPTTCRSDVLYLYDPRHIVTGTGNIGRLDDRPVQLLPLLDNTALKVLASSRAGAIAVQCDPTSNDEFMKVVFLPRPGMEMAATAALRSRAGAAIWNRSDFAPATVSVESLSEAVARRMEKDFGWLPPFVVAFAFLLLVILAGFALFDAARIRPEFQIRRAMGSSMPRLLWASAQRVFRMLAAAFALATLLLILWWSFAGTQLLSDGWLGLCWAAIVLVLAGCVAVVAHAMYVLLRLDAQLTLTTNVAGSRWKAALVGVCMGVMTFSLALFAMFSLGLNMYFHQLQNMPLGYAPTGLYAYAAIPLSARGRAGQDTASLLAEPLQSLALANGRVSVICEGPWSLDGLLADPNLKHVGISISGSAGLLDLMRISHTGRDIAAKDLQTGTARWIQTLDPEFVRLAAKFGHLVGTVTGLRVGALAPQNRSIVIEPLNSVPCPAPVVLYRANPGSSAGTASSALAGVQARIQAITADYSIQPAEQVSATIAQARQPLLQLKRFADLGFAAALLCMVLVASLTSAAYVNSRARVIAIRSALGEAPWRAALDAVLRSGLHALPALALAALVSGWMNSAVRFEFPDYPGLSVWELTALSLLIGVVIQSAMFASLWNTLSKTNFSAALRVE